MDATNLTIRKTALAPGTVHTVFSEHQEPENWPESVVWRTTEDLDLERLLEVLLGVFERQDQQRVSLPCLQQFVTSVTVQKLCGFLDDMSTHLKSSPHQVSCPSLIFTPSAFMYWGEIKQINDHIRKVSSEQGWPTLNLSRSYLQRQGARWVVAGGLYREYKEKTGFGTCFTTEGFTRYHARLLRFHETAFDCSVPFCQPVSDPEPLPLFRTNHYTREDYFRNLLEGLGYAAILPTQAKGKKKVKKVVEVKPQVVKEVAPAATVDEMAMEVDEEIRGVKRRCPEPIVLTEAERNGLERRPDWTKAMYETMPVLRGTMSDMLHQLAYLREKVRDQERERRKEGDKDYYNHKRQMRNVHVRYGEYERQIRRAAEENYREHEDWVELRKEWAREKEQLQDELYRERRLVGVMEGKLDVFEGRVDLKKSKGARRGKE